MRRKLASLMSKMEGNKGKEIEALCKKHKLNVSWQFDGQDTCFCIVCDPDSAKVIGEGLSKIAGTNGSTIVDRGSVGGDDDSMALDIGRKILGEIKSQMGEGESDKDMPDWFKDTGKLFSD